MSGKVCLFELRGDFSIFIVFNALPTLYKFTTTILLKLLTLSLPTEQHSHEETAFLLAPKKPFVACNWAGWGSNSIKQLASVYINSPLM